MKYPGSAELRADGLHAVTIQCRDGKHVVYGHGVYSPDSVLPGHNRKIFLANFKTVFEACAAFPQAFGVH